MGLLHHAPRQQHSSSILQSGGDLKKKAGPKSNGNKERPSFSDITKYLVPFLGVVLVNAVRSQGCLLELESSSETMWF